MKSTALVERVLKFEAQQAGYGLVCPECGDCWLGPWLVDGTQRCEECADTSKAGPRARQNKRDLLAVCHSATLIEACVRLRKSPSSVRRWLRETKDQWRLRLAREIAAEIYQRDQLIAAREASTMGVAEAKERVALVQRPWVLGYAERCLGQ
jgi:hypothetical protein